ncbi:Phosphoglycerate kinase [Methylacidimicrobium sp. AP8]|uniref:phosphoglycerate kinase n=1 Tax=Methylacidimicrobium sp. AP8 TaxID=2730359 RepID=UPI0018C049AB|nr:phosphoglycerate kinase [Methylacidimicrobium sp. AP8]CAB4243479.1 Phosphoglycerate kinase [Methylacidimicrobium sp. AP8]
MAKRTILDVEVRGKRVLVRVDFNVPIEHVDGDARITDDTRIRATLPTVQNLVKRGARVVLMSHLGRPKGKPDPKLSLRPVADRLGYLLQKRVRFSDDCIGAGAENSAKSLQDGEVLLLENLRFHPEEEKNDPAFSRQLAQLGEIYVNDAFGTAHRAHSSTEGVAHFLAERAIGLLMEKELHFLGEELAHPARPFVVILGGAKVSDKIRVIDRLLAKADVLIIGGAMAYTFYLAQGKAVGKSLVEPDRVEMARLALNKAASRGIELLLPVDSYIVEHIDFERRQTSPGRYTQPAEEIPDGWRAVDIGPATLAAMKRPLAAARTIFWNGPMGVFEIRGCDKGTFAVAEMVAENRDAVSIVGGGDSVKALHRSGLADRITFISTGGGASLEFLEGKPLPGISVIPDKAEEEAKAAIAHATGEGPTESFLPT